MPRPRQHDLDRVLDIAEELVSESGPSALTVRALADVSGMSNGAIYHAFGSRAGLLARAWLRAARRFLAFQRSAVADTRATRPANDAEAVVAAADAPAAFLRAHPGSARFLFAVQRDELIGDSDLSAGLVTDLQRLDDDLTALFLELSEVMWRRSDRAAVEVIRECVVELPTALLLRGKRTPDDAVRARLAAAVRAVVGLEPPSPR